MLVCDFGGQSAPQILFEQDGLLGNFTPSSEAWQGAAAHAESGIGGASRADLAGADAKKIFAFHINQREETIDLGGVAEALLATRNMQMQTFVSEVKPASVTAFSCNQRDEVRDLHDISGAIQAQPGMKQQTFVATTEPLFCLNDQGGDRMDVTENQTSTLRAGMGGHQPLVAIPINLQLATRGGKADTFGLGIGDDGDPAYTIQEARGHAVFQGDANCLNGWDTPVRVTSAEVTEQTSSAAHLAGGIKSPRMPPKPPAGFGYEDATAVPSPLGEQEGHMGRTESSPMRHTVSEANSATFAKVACALQEHGHQPIVMGSQQGNAEICVDLCPTITQAAGTSGNNTPLIFENHGIDNRYTGPLNVAPTISARYGTGGNNCSLVAQALFEGHGKDARYNGPLEVAPTISSSYGEGDVCERAQWAIQRAKRSGSGGRIVSEANKATSAATGGGNTPLAMNIPHVFSLDSAESNSMKSDNPTSGCRETDLARTLDTTVPNPAKGQGGLAIVQESYCIAGNIIDRQDHNGGNGCGFQADISYTLTGADRHAVYNRQGYSGFTESEVVGTQCARQYKDSTDLIATYQQTVGTLCSGDEKGIGNQYVEQDKVNCHEVTREDALGHKCVIDRLPTVNLVRRLTPLECERLQGFPDYWTEIPKCSDSARYKALGNSVAIPCVEYVLRGIAYFLRQAAAGNLRTDNVQEDYKTARVNDLAEGKEQEG